MCLIIIPLNDFSVADAARESGSRCKLFLRKCGERLAKFLSWAFSRQSTPRYPSSYIGSVSERRFAEPQVIYYPIFYNQSSYPPPYTSHAGQFTEWSVSELDSASEDSSDDENYEDTEMGTTSTQTSAVRDSSRNEAHIEC